MIRNRTEEKCKDKEINELMARGFVALAKDEIACTHCRVTFFLFFPWPFHFRDLCGHPIHMSILVSLSRVRLFGFIISFFL
jgi:hypothetical protein